MACVCGAKNRTWLPLRAAGRTGMPLRAAGRTGLPLRAAGVHGTATSNRRGACNWRIGPPWCTELPLRAGGVCEVAVLSGFSGEVAVVCGCGVKNRTGLPLRPPGCTGLPLRAAGRTRLPPRPARGAQSCHLERRCRAAPEPRPEPPPRRNADPAGPRSAGTPTYGATATAGISDVASWTSFIWAKRWRRFCRIVPRAASSTPPTVHAIMTQTG